MQIFRRLEYKYFVPYERLGALRRRFSAGMQHDGFSKTREFGRYTVRSIYFDTPRFLFYNEKMQGVKNRKKLRIRTYDTPGSDKAAFFEIKNKFSRVIFKERVMTALAEAPALLNGDAARVMNRMTGLDQRVMGKFLLIFNKLNLEPKVLVTYEREALQGLDDERLRVTFDMNVRSYVYPEVEDIFRDEDMSAINDRCFILEIKFDEIIPLWVRRIVSDYDLRQQPISKYCEGLDEWLSLKRGRNGWKV